MNLETLTSYSHDQWKEAAARTLGSAHTGFFIDGEFVQAVDGGRFEDVNPANREVIAAVSAANEKDVDVAVRAARRAFR
ncbi:MAG: aldehyde dehydrogenase family protein, partial [Woeseiaceae bacterium]